VRQKVAFIERQPHDPFCDNTVSKKRVTSGLQRLQTPAARRSPAIRARGSWCFWTARFCLALASGVAVYLLQHALELGPLGGCGPGSDCDRVLGTPWAYWLSLPVSSLALLAYVGLFAATFFVRPVDSRRFRPGPWIVALAIAMAIPLSAAWFVGIQALILKAFCKYCLAAHSFAVVGAAVFCCAAWTTLRPEARSAGASWRSRLMLGAAVGGVMAAGVLAAGQTLFPHRMNLVRVHSGTIRLDRRELPLIGPADAPQMIVSLFDYTCPDCRDMHRLLLEAQQRSVKPLGILAVPVPLNPACNSAVRTAQAKHTNACEFARLALAVRHADADAFQKLDRWLFSQQTLPSVDQARAQARQLVGEAALAAGLTNRWVEAALQTGVRLYRANERQTGSLRMPQLIIGEAVSVGPLRRVEDLFSLLEKNLPGYQRRPGEPSDAPKAAPK